MTVLGGPHTSHPALRSVTRQPTTILALMSSSLRLVKRPVVMLSLLRSAAAFVPNPSKTIRITAAPRTLAVFERRLHTTAGVPCERGDSNGHHLGLNTFGRLDAAASRSRKVDYGRNESGVQAGLRLPSRRLSTTAQSQMTATAGGEDATTVAASARTGSSSSSSADQITESMFADLKLSRGTQESLSGILGFKYMTKVQEQAIPLCLTGSDVLVKAKTGTGKTLAFLIPAVERIIHRKVKGISALIISPTRELAQQIAVEAMQLTKPHKMRVMCAVGGQNINRDLSELAKGTPHILVATPGRLIDLMENCKLGFEVQDLATLVFDEADRLLDMGFRDSIDKILNILPPKTTRQTVLFSATMPDKVESIASLAMRPDYQVVDCVGEETNSHENVEQSYAIVPLVQVMPSLLAAISEMTKNPEHKIIVFFVASRVVQAYAELFNIMGYDVLETHSRKSQARRTIVSNEFRRKTGVIMFTSDVSARGLDYPDVTNVIQVGLPSDAAQYVHRLGRTARAGKEGKGLLVLSKAESGFLEKLTEQPMIEVEKMDPGALVEARQKIVGARGQMSQQTLARAYVAWLGFYNSNLKTLKWRKESLVQEANFWITEVWGQSSPPAVEARTIGKMGLKGVAGVLIDSGGRGGRQTAGLQQQRRHFSTSGGRGRGVGSRAGIGGRGRGAGVGRGAGGRGGKR